MYKQLPLLLGQPRKVLPHIGEHPIQALLLAGGVTGFVAQSQTARGYIVHREYIVRMPYT